MFTMLGGPLKDRGPEKMALQIVWKEWPWQLDTTWTSVERRHS